MQFPLVLPYNILFRIRIIENSSHLFSFSATGKDPFTDSTFFNNETVPPKFTDPLPESQRQKESEEVSNDS